MHHTLQASSSSLICHMTMFNFRNRNWSFWPLKLHELANFRFLYPISTTKIFLKSSELLLSNEIHMFYNFDYFVNLVQKCYRKILLFAITRDLSVSYAYNDQVWISYFTLSDMSQKRRHSDKNFGNGATSSNFDFMAISWPSYSFLWI